jgi:hypothetical protein
MARRIYLPLILLISLLSIIASPASAANVLPEELARLKNSGATESVIQSKVEEQQQFLKEKWNQAQLFQFVAKVIPSAEIGSPIWSIASKSEMLLKFQDSDGYLSPKTRAEVIARQLNRALLIGEGQFTSLPRNGQSVVEFQNSAERLVIVSVSDEDATFFKSTRDQVAHQWATALNQFWISLPPVLLQPLPRALTLPDLVLLAKTGFTDRTLLTFFQFRNIDRTVKAEQIKDLGFSKEVTEYLDRRIAIDAPDRMHRWEYWGSNGYCGYSSGSMSTTISFGGSSGFHSGTQQRGTRSPSTRGRSVTGSHAAFPGKTTNHNH